MEKNWTTGSVLQSIWRFSLPYLLSYFLQTLYGMADLLIIGRFGTVADTTAVSVGSQVMHMLTVMLLGLAMGTTVCIGQAVGAGDRRRAGRFTGNTITLFFWLVVGAYGDFADLAAYAGRLGVYPRRSGGGHSGLPYRVLFRRSLYYGV